VPGGFPVGELSALAVHLVGDFSPTVIYEDTQAKHNLYLGGDNKLYYPTTEGYTVNACRAYFRLGNGLTAGALAHAVRSFTFDFGDAEQTAINEIVNSKSSNTNSAWYTLDGRRLDGKPTHRGIYINNGKKTVIK